MADLTLKGTLNLVGSLALNPDGGKVLVGDAGLEALVEAVPAPPAAPEHGMGAPVVLPPPPAAPLDAGPKMWIVTSFNKTVTAGAQKKPLAALGMVMQGNVPTWPGSLLPSANNPTVTVNFVPINVLGDQAVIFPSGAAAPLSANSGQ